MAAMTDVGVLRRHLRNKAAHVAAGRSLWAVPGVGAGCRHGRKAAALAAAGQALGAVSDVGARRRHWPKAGASAAARLRGGVALGVLEWLSLSRILARGHLIVLVPARVGAAGCQRRWIRTLPGLGMLRLGGRKETLMWEPLWDALVAVPLGTAMRGARLRQGQFMARTPTSAIHILSGGLSP